MNIPIWQEVGAECTGCFNTIDRVEDCKLYHFEGECLCKSCLTQMLEAHKYATKGLCEKCKPSEAKTVLPLGGQLLCIDCIIKTLDSD